MFTLKKNQYFTAERHIYNDLK